MKSTLSVRRWVGAVGACLLLSSMAAADGLPGEYLLSQRWREHFGEHSPLLNPAFLTEEDYISARIVFAPVLQGEFLLGEFGVTVPIGWHQSAGISILAEDGGEIDGGVIDPITGELGSSGKSVSNENLFIMLSYAINPWRRLSVGANLNIGYQSNYGTPLTGLGLDLGLAYQFLRHPVAGEHYAGLFLQNLIPPSMSADGLSLSTGDIGNYTGALKISWIGSFLEGRVDGGLDVFLKDLFWNEGEFEDLASSLEWNMSLRAGVWLLRLIKIRMQMAFDADAIDSWGLAGGVNVPSMNQGRDLEMLYQYNLATEGDQASSHSFYVRADLGRHREELYAKRLAKKMSVAPNMLYNRAMELYRQGQYWDAYFVFTQIAVQYPDFFKSDRVAYYRGRCLQVLDMREQSERIYKSALATYERSDIVPLAELGLVELYYRDGRYDELLDHYIKLNRADTPDSLRHCGGYLMGESLIKKNRLRDALVVLDKVPESHPDHIFAIHSAAVASFMLDDEDAGRERLEKAMRVVPKTPAQTNMLHRTYVLLGYLFFENQYLGDAITALRMVPAGSLYRDDALLGQAWTALRARQWVDCRAAAQQLAKASADPVLQEEANLLTAYTYMLESNFTSAVPILSGASARLDTLQGPLADEMRIRSEINERDRVSYDSLATAVVKISLTQQAAHDTRMTDTMHVAQKKIYDKLDSFYDYQYSFSRQSFFARSVERVKEDVEYALAVAQSAVSHRGAVGAHKKAVEKQQEIDEEIEKLKEEMNKLEEKDE